MRPLLISRFTPFPARWGFGMAITVAFAGAGLVGAGLFAAELGVRDPAWSPDGARLAVSALDQLRLVSPDGKTVEPLVRWTGDGSVIERDPAWSPDGKRIAFAANNGAGFDLYVVTVGGGEPTRLTTMAGDERWPSWTGDGRIVFAYHATRQWDLYVVDASNPASGGTPQPISLTIDDEFQPRVSPDGTRIAYLSNEGNPDGDVDLWVRRVPPLTGGGPRSGSSFRSDGRVIPLPQPSVNFPPRRVLRTTGAESAPSWAPAGDRIVFAAQRASGGSLWVASVDRIDPDGRVRRQFPSSTPLLLSRRGGMPAWSPDGQTIAVADTADGDGSYNGNPQRHPLDGPPMFGLLNEFRLRMLSAPLPPDAGERAVSLNAPATPQQLRGAFDVVWRTLRDLYYGSGPSQTAWEQLGETHRARARDARDEEALEGVIDDMIARQPLIKPVVSSGRAVVVSGHRLASEAGVRMLDLGGNVVDAAIATALALSVVEPDASGIGGDGTALVYLAHMAEPVVVDYKDQAPMRATLDNPRVMHDGQLVADGPAAANIPGTVAGLSLMHQRYGSRRVSWAQLLEPAIQLAEGGFVLDEALPTTITEARGLFRRYPEAARVFMSEGRMPRVGDKFVNRDYAATLRLLANEGATSFYRGTLARRIADDMASNGGLIGLEDLAQYRAIERAPVSGAFRGYTVFGPPPPIATGISLIEGLQILDRYQPRKGARQATDADYLHHALEAWKARQPLRRVADPERWTVDFASHLTPKHALDAFERIDPRRAMSFEEEEDESDPAPPPSRLGRGTTAFAVADTEGNMIVVTQTLSTWGGSFYASRGLGFLYNNHLRSFRATPGAYGQLLPLARSTTASNPTMVFSRKDNRLVPRFAVGAAGNEWIAPTVYGIIVNTLDGLDMQSAVEAPRAMVIPGDSSAPFGRVLVEDRFPRALLDDLIERGHHVQKIGRKGEVRYGFASAVSVDLASRSVTGGADPRRSHAAVPAQPRASNSR